VELSSCEDCDDDDSGSNIDDTCPVKSANSIGLLLLIGSLFVSYILGSFLTWIVMRTFRGKVVHRDLFNNVSNIPQQKICLQDHKPAVSIYFQETLNNKNDVSIIHSGKEEVLRV